MVSKGGSNEFHGEAFEYLRNSAIDAANYFDHPVAANNFARLQPYKRHNFGAAFGGPIKKDKTFFFASYEGLRLRLGQTLVDTVPGAGCHQPVGVQVTMAECPQLTAPATLSAVMAPILALYPFPNLANNQYTFPGLSPGATDYGQIRVDHVLHEKHA
jgi:hypothetical protein